MALDIPFGRYRLERRLGRGGMAEVFLARQEGPAGFVRPVALKRMLPHLSEDPTFVARFFEEARIAALLTHPNVVHVYDFGELDGSYFIAMEYVDGVPLTRFMGSPAKRMPLRHAIKVASYVCEGLNYAHSLTDRGVPLDLVHRDISPMNVLISRDGVVKIVDFGIAKITGSSVHTQVGFIRANTAYLSPEQARGKKVDPRSDVYNVGIILHELVTGVPLFRGKKLDEVLVKMRLVPPPSDVSRDVPLAVDRVVMRAMAHDRNDRYRDALEMRDALEGLLRQTGQTSDTLALAPLVNLLLGPPAGDPSRADGVPTIAFDESGPAAAPSPEGADAPTMREGPPSPGRGLAPASTERLDPEAATPPPPMSVHAAATATIARGASAPQDLGEPASADVVELSTSDLERLAEAVDEEHTTEDISQPTAASTDPSSLPPPTLVEADGHEPEGPTLVREGSREPEGPTRVLDRPPSWSSAPKAPPPQVEPEGEPRAPRAALLVALGVAAVLVLGAGVGFAAFFLSRPEQGGTVAPTAPGGPPSPPPAATKGRARVESQPPGAEILLDGEHTGRVCPALLEVEPGRPHRVTLRLEGHEPTEVQIETVAGELREVLVALRPLPAKVEPAPTLARIDVRTVPPGARVHVDGTEAEGETPLSVDGLATGEHQVRIERDGCDDLVRRVTLAEGERRTLELPLRCRRAPPPAEFGELSVTTVPWSWVYLGRRKLGQTPLAHVRVPAGRHTLKLVHPGRPERRRSVTIRSGELTKVRVSL